jgi:hypothetical protein
MTTVRTYSAGQILTRGTPEFDYARHVNMAQWCNEPCGDGYICSIREGHEGPQHVAVGGETVRAVKDREGHVEQPAFPRETRIVHTPTGDVEAPVSVFALVEAQRAELEQLRTIRDSLIRENERKDAEFEQFRETVKTTAQDYASRHGWCGVVNQALSEMGIDVEQDYFVDVEVTVESVERIRVRVSAANGEEAWQQVDAMNESDFREALAAYQGDDSCGIDWDRWNLTRTNASTHTQLAD